MFLPVFVAAFVAGVRVNLLYWRMLREVNAGVPYSQQLRSPVLNHFWGWTLLAAHKARYPDSDLRGRFWRWNVILVVLFIVSAVMLPPAER
jgi:hypothetical protein